MSTPATIKFRGKLYHKVADSEPVQFGQLSFKRGPPGNLSVLQGTFDQQMEGVVDQIDEVYTNLLEVGRLVQSGDRKFATLLQTIAKGIVFDQLLPGLVELNKTARALAARMQ